MPIARCNDIDICYETFGDPADAPLILIMGLGRQLTRWPIGLIDRLVTRGHHVVRFDNRDMGESTRFDAAGVPDLGAVYSARAAGQVPDVPYDLSDMAADTVGLMAFLGLSSAHILGASLGGMIAQTIAIEHPERVRTLTSIMSTTGRPGLPDARGESARLLFSRAPSDRSSYIEHAVNRDRVLNGPNMPFDVERHQRAAKLDFDRGLSPDGNLRQLAAVVASGSRHERLTALKIPTLVVHGSADELIDPACGRDTAECIAGARFLEIAGMAHSLPQSVWDSIVDAVAELTQEGGASPG